jgi:hypothetical protein
MVHPIKNFLIKTFMNTKKIGIRGFGIVGKNQEPITPHQHFLRHNLLAPALAVTGIHGGLITQSFTNKNAFK